MMVITERNWISSELRSQIKEDSTKGKFKKGELLRSTIS